MRPAQPRGRGRPRPVVEQVLVTRHGPVINSHWDPRSAKWLHAGERLWNLPHPHLPRPGTAPDAEHTAPMALAIRWTGAQPGTSLQAALDLNRAQDWAGFQAAILDVLHRRRP